MVAARVPLFAAVLLPRAEGDLVVLVLPVFLVVLLFEVAFFWGVFLFCSFMGSPFCYSMGSKSRMIEMSNRFAGVYRGMVWGRISVLLRAVFKKSAFICATAGVSMHSTPHS